MGAMGQMHCGCLVCRPRWTPHSRTGPTHLSPDCTAPAWPCKLRLGPQDPTLPPSSPACGDQDLVPCTVSSQSPGLVLGPLDLALPPPSPMHCDWRLGPRTVSAQSCVSGLEPWGSVLPPLGSTYLDLAPEAHTTSVQSCVLGLGFIPPCVLNLTCKVTA